jgi:hypothetical protein
MNNDMDRKCLTGNVQRQYLQVACAAQLFHFAFYQFHACDNIVLQHKQFGIMFGTVYAIIAYTYVQQLSFADDDRYFLRLPSGCRLSVDFPVCGKDESLLPDRRS